MKSVEAFAAAGGPVVGFCNGFQILLEAGLLEGAMLRNRSLQYRCEHVHVRVERTDTPWTTLCQPGLVMRIPIAHGEGNYFAAPDVIERLETNGQVIFRYVTAAGETTDAANPNGSLHNIAGICNERRNVVGPDAAPGARLRARARQRRRQGRARLGRRLAARGRAGGALDDGDRRAAATQPRLAVGRIARRCRRSSCSPCRIAVLERRAAVSRR